MKYFTMAELTRSETAKKRMIDNEPPAAMRRALTVMTNRLLDPIREVWGAPINVNSGYRSPELNAAVGGVANSQHCKGQAVDVTAGSPEENRALFELIKGMGHDFDQLIDEYDFKWLHISYVEGANRNQILHIS